MNINWKIKSFAYHWIDAFSLHRTLYYLQKNVTRRSRVDISSRFTNWLVHQDNLASLERPNVFEFGAGKDLSQNIYLSQYFGSQTVVDLFPMLDIDLANDAALQISKQYPTFDYHAMENISDLERFYKVHYIAPFDAAKTPFGDNAFDGCVSTDTLEHIPEDDVMAIFKELRRIIRPGGVISAIIDYSDHYSYTDRKIGPLHFLQYSADEFTKYNHYAYSQNRMRHYDYERIFAALGYKFIKNEALDMAPMPTWISPEFDKSKSSMCARKGIFLLQNAV